MGEIGHPGGDRVRSMAQLLGDVPQVLTTPGATVRARGAVRHQGGADLTWSHWPIADSGGAVAAGAECDAVVVQTVDGGVSLRGAPSGALPLYVDIDGDRVAFSSSLDALIRTRPAAVRPDWDGLAAMVAASGPLAGRTTVAGIQRLRPGEGLVRRRDGQVRRTTEWTWPEIETGGGTVADLAEALRATVGRLARHGPLISMLSGGWDSRLLLALADREPDRQAITALTTSSDTGTVMEELVAAQVAEHTEVPHEIVMPSRAEFAADLADFAAAADYQTAFHIWLVPLARTVLARREGGSGRRVPTILDGLGGGLFVGSSFTDDRAGRTVTEHRMAGITKYLAAADLVLRPEVGRRLTDRIRADAEPAVRRFLDHPFGSTFTAYTTRTIPGISLAPHGLMARTGPVATPFLSPAVVTAALRLPPVKHAHDRLYPLLTAAMNPVLAGLATAQQQVPWPRPHPRRVTSLEAVRHLRSLLLQEPVRALLAPALLDAGPRHWRAVLSTTGGQHLIRGLAVLSLWTRAYADVVTGLEVAEWTG